MDKIVIPLHYHWRDVFGIIETLDKTYVVPGWHEVPHGTTRDQIVFDPNLEPSGPPDYFNKPIVKKPEPEHVVSKVQEWTVDGSRPGSQYKVLFNGKFWSCSCPASQFRRHTDCKHIKSKKIEAT